MRVALEPIPDHLLSGLCSTPGPEARYEQQESVSLAFITALQTLPPRQLAALVLRDVLGYPANDVGDMLHTTTESVTSLLKRARATLRAKQTRDRESLAAASTRSSEEAQLVDRFVRAYEASDTGAIIALLTDDVFLSMPPMPFEYEGKAIVTEFWQLLFNADRQYRLVPTRANGQPGRRLLRPGR